VTAINTSSWIADTYFSPIQSATPPASVEKEIVSSAIPLEAGVRRFYVVESADSRPYPTNPMSPLPTREPTQIYQVDDEFHFIDA
jgi:hypothetical protein